MSTVIEDRLTAALHARAELVQPEDLHHRHAPEPTPTPLWRRPAVVALVAAAAVVAVAVPVVLRSDHSGHQHPQPSDHFPLPEQKVVHALSTDVNGDGKADRVQASGRTLTVRLATDPAHRLTVVVHRLDGLVGVVRTGAPARAIVVATRNRSPYRRNWTAYHVVGGKLEAVTVKQGSSGPDPDYDGLVLYGEHAVSWLTPAGVLMTAAQDPAQEGQRRLMVHVSRFTADRGALRLTPVGQWCWDTATQSLPAPCPAGVSYAYDPGSHGSLPALLPVTNPAWISTGAPPGSEVWHQGSTRLRLVKGPHHASRYRQVYDVVGTIDGQQVSAPVGLEQTLLYKAYVDLGHGVRALVANMLGDPWRVLAVTDHGLVRARVDQPRHGLRPGTQGLLTGGPVRLAITWFADGKMYTRVETADFGHYRTYLWQATDSSGTTLTPVDLGIVCMDDVQATYGTCS